MLGLILVISGLAYAATKYASDLARVLDPETLSQITSTLFGKPSGPNEPETDAATGGSDRSAAQALPSSIPSATPTVTPTATQTTAPTETPLHTNTPTQTRTPSATRTARPTRSATPTPSETPEGALPPTSTLTATPPPTATGFPDCSPSGNPGFESTLLILINDERNSTGLPAYHLQGKLKSAAQSHNTDMACNGFFSHTGSDGSSKEDRVTAQGYDWTSVGENIFATGDTSSNAPQLALNFWMASPPNEANILHQEYTEIGIGYTHEPSSPFGGYFTLVFALP